MIIMDYTRNADKWGCAADSGLYNSVLSIEFGNEGPEPLTLQEAKDWCKIEQDTDDVIVTALIIAARRMCESFSGIGFISKTVTAVINNSNGGFILPYGPVTVDPTGVDANSNDLNITYPLGMLDTTGIMQVTYTAGYADLPEDLKTALKCQVLFLYENRGESTAGGLSPIAKMILEPLRKVL